MIREGPQSSSGLAGLLAALESITESTRCGSPRSLHPRPAARSTDSLDGLGCSTSEEKFVAGMESIQRPQAFKSAVPFRLYVSE